MCLLSASEARIEGRTLAMDGNAFAIIPNFWEQQTLFDHSLQPVCSCCFEVIKCCAWYFTWAATYRLKLLFKLKAGVPDYKEKHKKQKPNIPIHDVLKKNLAFSFQELIFFVLNC